MPDADVPAQHVGDGTGPRTVLIVEQPDHRVLGMIRLFGAAVAVAVPMRMSCPASAPSPKKSPGTSIATTASLPIRESKEASHFALDMPHVVAEVALGKDDLAFSILHDSSGRSGRFEILLHIEPAPGLRLDRGSRSSHDLEIYLTTTWGGIHRYSPFFRRFALCRCPAETRAKPRLLSGGPRADDVCNIEQIGCRQGGRVTIEPNFFAQSDSACAVFRAQVSHGDRREWDVSCSMNSLP